MRKGKIIPLVILALFTITIMVQISYANTDENPIIHILDDETDMETDRFEKCPVDIVIETKSYNEAYDVLLEKWDGSNWVLVETLDTDVPADGEWHEFEYTCTETGDWQVKAGKASTHFSIQQFFVIPEAPLGVITILAACFAGLGVRRIRYRQT